MQGSDLAELMQRGGRADGHTQIHVALKAGQTMRAWSTWWPTFHIGLQIINSHTAISSGTYMDGGNKGPSKPCTRSTRTKPIMILRATRGHNRATHWWIYKQGQRLGHGGQEKKNSGTRSDGKRRKIAFNSLHAKSTWSKWRTSRGHCRNSLPSQPCKKLQCNSRPRRPCRPQGHRVRGLSDAETPTRCGAGVSILGFHGYAVVTNYAATLGFMGSTRHPLLGHHGRLPYTRGADQTSKDYGGTPSAGRRQTLERYDFNRPGHCSGSGQSFPVADDFYVPTTN